MGNCHVGALAASSESVEACGAVLLHRPATTAASTDDAKRMELGPWEL
jgi:hypothetical protein